ncbi:MAG: hypothetical protein Q4G67_04615 [Actinomycetia bacterium]|nr:hypothetical protein [Actinomycetes bacterium]
MSISTNGIVSHTLIKEQRIPRLLLDLVTAGGVGLIAAFMIMYVSRPIADAAIFESSLRYTDLAEVGPESSAEILVRHGTVDVVVRVMGDATMYESADATIWVPQDDAALQRFLGRAMVVVDPLAEGVILDQATAFALKVELGSEVLVKFEDGNAECSVPVVGAVRPYQEPGSPSRSALAVLNGHACAETAGGSAAFGLALDTGAGESKANRLRRVISEQPVLSSAVSVIAVGGLALWYFLARRITSRMFRDGAPGIAVLTSLGVSPRRTRLLLSMLVVSAMAPAAVVSSLGARTVVGAVVRFYIQPMHLISVVLLLIAASVIASRPPRPNPSESKGNA